ncbi:Replication factor A protein 1 [Glycine soja]
MARIPDKIKSIDGSRETLKLAVRIMDLWFIGTPNKSEQAEMVTVDSEGDQIHVVCKADQLKSWKAYLKENSTYVMHNFKVVKNDGQFRVCEHEYKLVFIGVTVVREAYLHELPFKEFRFVEFGNVVAGILWLACWLVSPVTICALILIITFFPFFNDLFLFSDIIGVVDQVLFWHVSSKNTRVVFRMKDLRILFAMLDDGYLYLILMNGEVLSCTLWENYCMQFLAYLNERGNDGPIVIILTHARIKDAQDLGVEVSPIFPPGDLGSSQLSRASQLSSKDAFLSKSEAKTISEINGISEDVVCVTMDTISKIVVDNHSWCYPACIQCHRKTYIQTGPFTCGCGKDNDQPVLRYRVEVMVSQNNDSSKFLLWDRECAELIGQTADEVNRVKIEDGDVDLNASPQALDRLLGYVLAFKVRIQSKFRNAIVLRYLNELDLINVVLDMLADTENYQHAKRSNSAKARINRKLIASDSSESVNFESTQGSDSNFLTAYEDCQSPTNQPVINTEGYSDLGDQLMQCRYCNAQMWYDKRISKDKNCGSPRFSLCCGDGKVELSLLQNPPQYLQQLLFDDNTIDSKNYQHNLRAYNMMFAFTCAGIKLEKTINDSRGPTTIRIQGQPCHRIGSLLPMLGKNPNLHNYISLTQKMKCKGHIVSSLSHMLDEHYSHAKSFRMTRDRLADDEVDNIKLQLIAARGKDGRVYNMPNVPEIAALIVGDFHPGSKRDIIVETQNGELQRIHELHPSYLPLQYPILFPYGEDGYRAYILHRYTMVESERLSYIRNNQKKLRVDKYCSLQNSLDTGTAKGLTKGKRVILPSTFVGSPRYMDQLYFDGMAICSHVGFPNLFITLTCNPNWLEIRRLLSPLNLKPIDRLDIVSRIFRLKYEQMLSDLTKGQLLGKINDDTLRNLTLIEIEQLLHINQRSLKDYPTMPYPQDINLTSYLQNNLMNKKQFTIELSKLSTTMKVGCFSYTDLEAQEKHSYGKHWQEAELHIPDLRFLLHMQYPSRDPISRIVEPDKMSMSPLQSPWPFKLLRRQFPIMLSYAMTINKSQGQSLSMVGLYLPKPIFTHGQLYVALSRVNLAKGLKILIHDNEQKSMNSTTNVVFKENLEHNSIGFKR